MRWLRCSRQANSCPQSSINTTFSIINQMHLCPSFIYFSSPSLGGTISWHFIKKVKFLNMYFWLQKEITPKWKFQQCSESLLFYKTVEWICNYSRKPIWVFFSEWKTSSELCSAMEDGKILKSLTHGKFLEN